MRNFLPTYTFAAAAFLSCSISSQSCATDEYGKEKRRAWWAFILFSPCLTSYNYEPCQTLPFLGASGHFCKTLQSSLWTSAIICALFSFKNGKWEMSCPPVLISSCLLFLREEAPFQRGAKCWLQNSHCLKWSGRAEIQAAIWTHRMLSVRLYNATLTAHTAQNSRSALQTQASEVWGIQVM